MLTAGLGWAWAGRRGRTATFALLALPTLVVLLVGGIVMSAFSSGFMAGRFRQVVPDLADREANWTGGMASAMAASPPRFWAWASGPTRASF